MTFILKCTRFIYTAIRVTNKRGLVTRGGTLFLGYPKPRYINLRQRNAGTNVSAAVKHDYSEIEAKLENSLYQLNKNVRYRNILVEDIEEIISGIKMRGDLKEPELILLLRCCTEVAFMATQEKRIALAETIWSMAENFGLEFNLYHYNTLLSVFVENRHKFQIDNFLNILSKNKLEPNIITYKLLLRAHCQQGSIAGAGEILMQMKKINQALNEEDFSALIEGHCEAGVFEEAVKLLSVMEERKITPTLISFNKLLIGFAKHGKIEELNSWCNKLAERGFTLQNSTVLEIIYNLALNNHESEIDSFLGLLTRDTDNLYYARTIQKLLHKKFDSLALKIFEHSIADMPMDSILLRGKFIIKHFVLYREPKEVFMICKELEEKGWAKGALGYAWRNVNIAKDEIAILKFLNDMREEGLVVRSHYYWPLIIKASGRGKAGLQSILKKSPKNLLLNDGDTIQNVIFPRYCQNLRDVEFLYSLGIDKNILLYCLFIKKLKEVDLRGAEKLLFNNGIMVLRRTHTLNCLVTAFTKKLEEKDAFLNILNAYMYDCYYHDVFSRYSDPNKAFEEHENEALEEHENEALEEHENEALEEHEETPRFFSIFDYVIKVLAKRLNDDEVFADLLQGMLERKMGISPKMGDFMASSFQSEKIKDLAKKLASPEAEFKVDLELFRSKIWKLQTHVFNEISDKVKNLIVSSRNTSLHVPSLIKELGPDASPTDKLFIAFVLGHKGRSREGFKMLKDMANEEFPSLEIDSAAATLLKKFLFFHSRYSSDNVVEIINLGPSLGLSEELTRKICIYLIQSSPLVSAVKVYNFCAKQGHHISSLRLLIRVCTEGDNGTLERVLEVSSSLKKFLLTNFLVIALATSGKIRRAKEVLESSGEKLQERLLYRHCELMYLSYRAKIFENYLKLVLDISSFDRSPLYKILLGKYAFERNIQKAHELCTTILEDPFPDYNLMKNIMKFKKDPTLQKLKHLAKTVEFDTPIFDSEFKLSKKRRLSSVGERRSTVDLLNHALDTGKIPRVMEVINEYQIQNLEDFALSCLEREKFDEYLQLLESCVEQRKFDPISSCFNFAELLPLLKNEEYFQKYKTLVIKCLEEGYVSDPLIGLFVNCVKIPSKLKEAEALYEQYPTQFKNISFLKLCYEAKLSGNEFAFYKNFISSDQLKINFSENCRVIYNKLIRMHFSKKNLTKALEYVEMAVSDAAEKYIDKNLIESLNKELKRKGKSFPHPELLSE